MTDTLQTPSRDGKSDPYESLTEKQILSHLLVELRLIRRILEAQSKKLIQMNQSREEKAGAAMGALMKNIPREFAEAIKPLFTDGK